MSVNSFISTSTMKRRVGAFAKKHGLDKETMSKEIEIPSWIKCVYGTNPAMQKGIYYPDVDILVFGSISGESTRLANVVFEIPDNEYFNSVDCKDVDWDLVWAEVCTWYNSGKVIHWTKTNAARDRYLVNEEVENKEILSKYQVWLKDFEVRTVSEKLTVAVSASHQPIIKSFIERYAKELKVKEDNNVS